MRWDGIMEGFWDSKYARFLCMQVLHKVLNVPEYGWTMPFSMVGFLTCLVKVSQGFK